MVTIGSNEKAIASQNSIGDTFKDIAQEFKMKHNISDDMIVQNDPNKGILLFNKSSMTTQIKKNDDAPVEGEEAATPATTETPETSASVDETPATEANSVTTEVNEVEALKNTIEEMKKSHESAIQTLKDEYDAKLESETNKIRETERANLAKVVGETTNSAGVKTPDDLRNKYIRK